MIETKTYQSFLHSKIKLAEKHGFDIETTDINPWHKPHVKDIVKWAVKGGRRAICVNFGMHKTAIQLELVVQNLRKHGGNGIIVCPLAVHDDFYEDAAAMGIRGRIKYITHSDEIDENNDIYLTNYERVRAADRFDPSKFTVTSADEASVLRTLSSETSEAFRKVFRQIPIRYIATATPAPNRYLELTHYADYLGIMDRGQILTRFFERNSKKAGDLNLFKKREKEFWYWINSWAVVAIQPSDINPAYSDDGYRFPDFEIKWHQVSFEREKHIDKRTNQVQLHHEVKAGVGAEKTNEEKSSIPARVTKMQEILNESPDDHFVIWHYREDERRAIKKSLPGIKMVWGSQSTDQREDHLRGFKKGTYQYLGTKPSIAGSGCNFQYFCHRAMFLGIDDNFNDFLQAIFRIIRFGQKHKCGIDIIYTDAQAAMRRRIEKKWALHLMFQGEMTTIIRKYGLNSDLYMEELKRSFFKDRKVIKGKYFELVNNDNVRELETREDNSVDMIHTSIPFGNHYEYSDYFECFGHNVSNDDFLIQMDFLTPHLHRVLKPGRIAAIHVKDRIRYNYQTNCGFITTDPFSSMIELHFIKHGFRLLNRITITTDVVAENNQSYRLTHQEQCKDGTKMGVGLPEYLLVFRKEPTDRSNGYADVPVSKSKEEYPLSRWQLDAHGYWKSNGERLWDEEALKRMGIDDIYSFWKEWDINNPYDFEKHVELYAMLEKINKLPKVFMVAPPVSTSDFVWTDINRMNTLNLSQTNKKAEKHICPLQHDITRRAITRWSNKGDKVLDPFNGIGTVTCDAIKLGRIGLGIELNTGYWEDSVKHCQIEEMKKNRTALFGDTECLHGNHLGCYKPDGYCICEENISK